MFENENRSIYDTRRKVMSYYKEVYLSARHDYIDSLDRLIAFTSYNNYKYILKCECGEVHVNEDYTLEGLHQRFGMENTERLLDMVEDVNKKFNLMHEKYVSYFIKCRELGF